MISAIVLSKNNENTISRTLESLQWCDEILVIDDESNDNSTQIAKKYTKKVYTRALHNDFSAQRNFGLTKAKGEWVLFVDSDEVVSSQLAQEIQSKTNPPVGGQKSCNGYYVKRKDWFLGTWLTRGEIGSIRLLRLGKRSEGIWHGTIHETWDIKGETDVLTHPLEHFPHHNVAQFLDKINTYTSIRAQELYRQNHTTSIFEMFIYPSSKFILNYFFRLGFLDGIQGAIMACMMCFHSFMVRAKLWQLQQKTH